MIHNCPIHEQKSDSNFTAPYPVNLMFFYIILKSNNLQHLKISSRTNKILVWSLRTIIDERKYMEVLGNNREWRKR